MPLLNRTKQILKNQTNLGQITAYNVDKSVVYMDVFDNSSDNKYNLYEVNLDSGIGKLIKKGKSTTFNWYLDNAGNPLARENFDKLTNTYSIRSFAQDTSTPIYKSHTRKVPFEILATSSNQHLVTLHKSDSEEYLANFSLISGEIEERLFTTTNDNIDTLIMGKQQTIFAVSHSGLVPQYTFFNDTLKQQFNYLYQVLPEHAIELISWDDKFNNVIIRASGADNSGELYLYQLPTKKLLYWQNNSPTLILKMLQIRRYLNLKHPIMSNFMQLPLGHTNRHHN